jgi:hypothetical protein
MSMIVPMLMLMPMLMRMFAHMHMAVAVVRAIGMHMFMQVHLVPLDLYFVATAATRCTHSLSSSFLGYF